MFSFIYRQTFLVSIINKRFQNIEKEMGIFMKIYLKLFKIVHNTFKHLKKIILILSADC